MSEWLVRLRYEEKSEGRGSEGNQEGCEVKRRRKEGRRKEKLWAMIWKEEDKEVGKERKRRKKGWIE